MQQQHMGVTHGGVRWCYQSVGIMVILVEEGLQVFGCSHLGHCRQVS